MKTRSRPRGYASIRDEHGPRHRHRRIRGAKHSVSWLDWKLGARLWLKYPALTIIGGLSLAAAIAIGVIGIEVVGEVGRVQRLETQDTEASRVELWWGGESPAQL